jgi:tRNA G18 (ribose-2'-O)-methylase SpoU
VDQARYDALEVALATHANITSVELLSEDLAGTPPARIYRSFVAPRPGKTHILEPVERAALRTAQQIDLAMRQVRADRAAYLRNTDRSMSELVLDIDEEEDKSYESTNESAREKHRATMYPARPHVHPIVLVLDNVRSAFNVGSLFRTAETAGLAEVVTVGITAHPPHPKLRKTAMSAVDVVPTRHFADCISAISALKDEGYQIVAMETTSRSECYTKANYERKVALVLGNEVTGVDTRVMDSADMIIEIPTYGIKNSLNVASAGPIVAFEILRQLRDIKLPSEDMQH